MGTVALLTLAPACGVSAAVAPALVAAKGFAVLGGSTVANVPAAGTVINGDPGVAPGLAITGFPPGIAVPPGTIHAGDAAAQSARNGVTAADIPALARCATIALTLLLALAGVLAMRRRAA